MKRFLIFLAIFPAVATACFYAVLYILTGAELDSVSGPASLCLLFAVPGLLVALFDWLVARASISPVVATTLLTYGLSTLVMAFLFGVSKQVIVLGLIGGVPAGVCSWLSNKRPAVAQ